MSGFVMSGLVISGLVISGLVMSGLVMSGFVMAGLTMAVLASPEIKTVPPTPEIWETSTPTCAVGLVELRNANRAMLERGGTDTSNVGELCVWLNDAVVFTGNGCTKLNR